MSKMNFNGKKETAEKNECQNNEEATNLQQEQENAAEECAQTDNVTEELDELKKKYNELNDSHLRLMAEFDNYRKRTDKEKKQNYEIGASDFILKILPVVDNFERGLDALSEEEKEGAFAQGFIKIYQQMITVLEEIGVKPMDAVGKEFNPDFHNAVMHEENEEMGENLVSEEFQKGYMYKDGVLRHSMVKVVN